MQEVQSIQAKPKIKYPGAFEIEKQVLKQYLARCLLSYLSSQCEQ